MTIETVHEALLRANLTAPMTAEDALLWMALLHTHEIHFREPLLRDRPTVTHLAPITSRHAADVMAALWRGRKRAERGTSSFWYHEYNEKAGYQIVDNISPDRLHRLQELRDQLATDPRILRIVPED